MFIIRRRMFLMLALCGLAWSLPLWARQHDTGFLNRPVAVDGATYNYQVFVPSGFSMVKLTPSFPSPNRDKWWPR